MKTETRTRILKSAAEIIWQKGFQDAGLAEILSQARVPKGSFYFYFRNKRDLGLQVIDYFAQRLTAQMERLDREPACSPLENLRHLYRRQAELFRKNGFTGGCPIGNLALEMGDRDPIFRKKLHQVMSRLKQGIQAQLEEARIKGEIPETMDLASVADFIFNSWEGTLMQMKVSRSLLPHQIFDRMIFEHLLANKAKSAGRRKRQ